MIRRALVVIAALAGACARAHRPDARPPVRYAARAALGPVRPGRAPAIRVEVEATNYGRDTAAVPASDCVTSLRLYRDAARRAPPAWDELAPTQPRRVCLLAVVVAQVPPGGTAPLPGAVVPVTRVLGDSLLPGPYYAAVVLSAAVGGGPPREVAAGRVDLPAPTRQ